MYVITSEMFKSLLMELLKLKIGIAVCFVILLIIATVYVIEKVKGE